MRSFPPPTRGKPGWAILVGGLVLLALAVGWYSLRSRGPDLGRVANLGAPGEVVVFFGDSITQGYGVRPEDSFPSLVARALGIAFVNAGIPGDTTAAGLARIERDVIAHRPRLTLVEFGGNDFLRRVPLEETLSNLDGIVRTLVSQGMMVVILEVNVGLMGDPYLDGYRAVAKRYGAVLVEDVMKGILADPDLKVDGIHPNAQGHRVIAERVIRMLRLLLQEADRRRGSAVRQSLDFPLPALPAMAKLHLQ
jgi:acyl-CoA thioesterase-1